MQLSISWPSSYRRQGVAQIRLAYFFKARKCEGGHASENADKFQQRMSNGRSKKQPGSGYATVCALKYALKHPGLGCLQYSAKHTSHRFQAALTSLCIWYAGCAFFTCARLLPETAA
eukprot:1143162-Pelagomonas_calceolata.AAC.4